MPMRLFAKTFVRHGHAANARKNMQRIVKIDCMPESVESYRRGWAVVVIDVIRATTTAITAIQSGRRCFLVPNLQVLSDLAKDLPNPLMVGELNGDTPQGFEVTNSPAMLARRSDIERPMILYSSSGTKIMYAAQFA